MGLPAVSIITPTEGRPDMVATLLKSSHKARLFYSGWTEHLIVDNSEESVSYKIEEICRVHEAKYIKADTDNVRKKRNLGAELSKGDILFFLDSDIEPTEEIITTHIESLTIDAPGSLGTIKFCGKPTLWNTIMETTALTQSFNYAENYKTALWGPAANLMVWKNKFEAINGFTVDFPALLGGDDLDLTLRLTDTYGPLKCTPKAICFHERRTWASFQSAIHRSFRWGRMEFYLLKRHEKKAVASPLKFWVCAFLAFFVTFFFSLEPLKLAVMFFTYLIFSLLLFQIYQGKRGIKSFITPFLTFGRASFELIFELGCIKESLHNRSLLGLKHTLMPDPANLASHEYFVGINLRANFTALLLTLLVGVLL